MFKDVNTDELWRHFSLQQYLFNYALIRYLYKHNNSSHDNILNLYQRLTI